MPTTVALNVGPFVINVAEVVVLNVPAAHEYDAVIRFLNKDPANVRFLSIFEYITGGSAADPQSPVLLNWPLQPNEMFEYGQVILAGPRILSAKVGVNDPNGIITAHVHGWDTA